MVVKVSMNIRISSALAMYLENAGEWMDELYVRLLYWQEQL